MSSSALTATFVLVLPLLCHLSAYCAENAAQSRPAGSRLRIGVVGLEHGHVYGFLQGVMSRADVELVGMAEASEELLRRYGKHHHKMADSVLFSDLDKMLDTARPQAVAVFTGAGEHLKVVEACARRGIHVMMEKPPAVSFEQAKAMQRTAEQGKIHVMFNYETTWYPNTPAAYEVIRNQKRIGKIRRIVALTGHQGPKEIGMPREFLDLLTDPKRSGAGALFDFGCYGVNMSTWLMGNQRPRSVTAIVQKLKSDPAYEKVDDEATIILEYADAQAVIQASWNWPHNRKDMEIYGEHGSFLTLGADAYRLTAPGGGETRAEPPKSPENDPINYLAAVARGEIKPSGPSSLEVNIITAEILDAARESAKTGRKVVLTQASQGTTPNRPD